jgi:hypothetical protein
MSARFRTWSGFSSETCFPVIRKASGGRVLHLQPKLDPILAVWLFFVFALGEQEGAACRDAHA